MISKHYYRIEELEPKFGISKSDVLYLVEQNKIRLAFYQKATHYLIGGWLKNGFVAYGSVNYEGVVTVERDIGLKVFAKGLADTLSFQLCERDKINYISGEYPFSIQAPNDYLYKWSAKNLENISWERIPAKVYPAVVESGMSMIFNTIKAFAEIKSQGNKAEEFKAIEDKHYGKFPKMVLRGTPVTLNLSDACVLSSDLEILLGKALEISEIQNIANTNIESKRLTKFDNDFDELLAKICKVNKGIKQKEVMRILTEEARIEEDTRKYDTRNILLDEVEGKIVWMDFGSTKKEKAYSPKTIANRISEIRKILT